MSYMKRYIVIIFAVAAAFCLDSCTLDSERYGAINTTVFPANQEDCEALVVGNAYAPFRSRSYDGLYCCNHDGVHVLGDMSTDIGDCAWDPSLWSEIIYLNPDANLTHGVVKLYRNNINGITKMTNTLERIRGVEMDEAA